MTLQCRTLLLATAALAISVPAAAAVTRAAAFDDHYAVFRYGPKRALALDVLR